MFDNEHFIRSRSFSGWTHTLLVSRATASPWKRPLRSADLDVDDLWRPLTEGFDARDLKDARVLLDQLNG